MAFKVITCNDCGRRWRGQEDWNVERIAGLDVGYLCPSCQIAQVAEQGEETHASRTRAHHKLIRIHELPPANPGVLNRQLRAALVHTYHTPQMLRLKADRLQRFRSDPASRRMVAMMREIADATDAGHDATSA